MGRGFEGRAAAAEREEGPGSCIIQIFWLSPLFLKTPDCSFKHKVLMLGVNWCQHLLTLILTQSGSYSLYKFWSKQSVINLSVYTCPG